MSARGRLRVLLGAAPGVGKTYAMLDEGRHLLGAGRDVVVAIVETHGRAATAAMVEGLEVLPRARVSHRGVTLDELDLQAVLRRRPEVALVDELAHTNAPGSMHEKRWQDVEELLAAGIDVISTVNIQHIESLNDVVQQITGVPQRETIPDHILRSADQVEVVDLAPQSLRDRLAKGEVYPAERIDAALSNYFRLGNLTALRELALLWLADEVDQALKTYRAEHGIDAKWEARERVVVTLTGGPEGETLLRRGARIAARSGGGELIAVHVTTQDGLRDANPVDLAAQRALLETLGGSYHQLVGENVPATLVEFARSVNATQLVIGVSRRSRLAALLTGPGIGSTVIREAGSIDVHIVNHEAAGRRLTLPNPGGALTLRRRLTGFALALAAGPLLTWPLVALRSSEALTSDVLAYQLLTVIVALVGGIWPALFAAVLSGLTLDFFFIEPFNTITVSEPLHLVALCLYVAIAALVSFVVDQAARMTRAARRSAAEAELMQSVAGSIVQGQDAVEALLTRTREAFGLDAAELAPASTSEHAPGPLLERVPVDDDTALLLRRPTGSGTLTGSERRLLGVIVAQLRLALERNALADVAREVEPLAASERVRSSLLAALSHDLRRPLASATAAVTGLRSMGKSLSQDDRAELLTTAEESLDQLGTLITDLLDVSRVQAGVLAVSTAPIDPADAILPALEELGLTPADVELELLDDTPAALADPVLLQRVIVNLLDNARRYSRDRPVRITTSAFGGRVQVRIIDHGPGIPADRRDDVFVPFQRLGDTDNTTGLGLGLALAKGFVESMGAALTPEDTPGGGLTMVISLAEAEAGHARETGFSTEATAPGETAIETPAPARERARP